MRLQCNHRLDSGNGAMGDRVGWGVHPGSLTSFEVDTVEYCECRVPLGQCNELCYV